MDFKTKARLDVLMEEFMWLQTDEDLNAFDAKWRVFYSALDRADAKIATTAWYDAIFENLGEIRKLIFNLPEGGDYTTIGTLLEKIATSPFLQKTVAVNV
jgi:hypothetical protein